MSTEKHYFAEEMLVEADPVTEASSELKLDAYGVQQKPAYSVALRASLIPIGFMFFHYLVQIIVGTLVSLGFVVSIEEIYDFSKLQDVALIGVSISSFFSIVGYVLFLVFGGTKVQAMRKEYWSLRLTDLWKMPLISLGGAGVITLGIMLLTLLPTARELLESYQKSMETLNGSPVWLLISTVILVPVAEELLFRGIIYREFKLAMPDWANIVVTGCLFGLFHLNPIQSIYAALLGMMLTALRIWGKSIWLPILSHMFFNFIGGFLPVVLGDSAWSGVLEWVEVAFIPIGILVFVLFYKKRAHGAGVQV